MEHDTLLNVNNKETLHGFLIPDFAQPEVPFTFVRRECDENGKFIKFSKGSQYVLTTYNKAMLRTGSWFLGLSI